MGVVFGRLPEGPEDPGLSWPSAFRRWTRKRGRRAGAGPSSQPPSGRGSPFLLCFRWRWRTWRKKLTPFPPSPPWLHPWSWRPRCGPSSCSRWCRTLNPCMYDGDHLELAPGLTCTQGTVGPRLGVKTLSHLEHVLATAALVIVPGQTGPPESSLASKAARRRLRIGI